MKTKSEHKIKNISENGNALIYILIAIALFAALSFTLSRRTDNNSTSDIDTAKTELYADQLIAYAAQAKNAIDQMIISGSSITDLDFTLPSEAGFNTAPHTHKLFHPASGGLSPANIAEDITAQVDANPPAGWYIGLFNNVEWTKTSATDVILTAYQISQNVCESLNKKITGSTTIPALSGNLKDSLTDEGSNDDLDIASCAACEGHNSLCVSDSPPTMYAFYNVMASR